MSFRWLKVIIVARSQLGERCSVWLEVQQVNSSISNSVLDICTEVLNFDQNAQ